MGRHVALLTPDTLVDLPVHARECMFWQQDPVQRARQPVQQEQAKRAWLSKVLGEWGSCGRVLYVDDCYAGHLLWAPASYLPGAVGFATAPVSEDAVLLATGHVVEALRHGGLGRLLVQAMAKDLLTHRGVRAVEAFGDTRGVWLQDQDPCVLPVEFLASVGFATQRSHATYPRMRMDLTRTVTWREEVETAFARLRGAVTKQPSPAPEHRSSALAHPGPGPVSRQSSPRGRPDRLAVR